MMNKSTISESSNEDEMEYTNEEFKFDQEANKELPDDTFQDKNQTEIEIAGEMAPKREFVTSKAGIYDKIWKLQTTKKKKDKKPKFINLGLLKEPTLNIPTFSLDE